MTEMKELNAEKIEEVKRLFAGVFSAAPWNDDWSDEKQLHGYIIDLMGNRNSLSFGLYENGCLTGIAIGSEKHWWEGTEYHIDELCIKTTEQGKGLGRLFLEMIEKEMQSRGIARIFLQTGRHAPAYRFYLRNGFEELEDHASLVKKLKKTALEN